MTSQQRLILAALTVVAVVIFAVLGCFAVLWARSSTVNTSAAIAAATQQPAPTAASPPLTTATPSPPATPSPTQTLPPTPTSTRVVTQTVLPTPTPTPANCIEDVDNFGASGIITDEQVTDYLRQTIPLIHLDNCQGIRYIIKPESDLQTPTTGRFTPLFRQISVYQTNTPFQSREILLGTLIHEVGHNVHANIRIVNPDLNTLWKELHGLSQARFAREGMGFVSDYARTDEFEDFAESYRAYVHQPETLKVVSSEKYEFMRLYVFAGYEYSP